MIFVPGHESANVEGDSALVRGARESRRELSLLSWAGIVVAVYFVFAVGAIYLSRQPGSIAMLWYANAAATSLLLARRAKDWPALLAAVALGNLAANLQAGDPLRMALLFIPGNVCEVLFAGYLLRRFCSPSECVSDVATLIRALVLGGIAPAALGATLGSSMLAAFGLAPFSSLWPAWLVGSAMGSVSMLPLGLLLVARGWRPVVDVLARPEVVALLLLSIAVALTAPTSLPFPFVYICVALVLLASIGRFAGAAVGVLCCSLAVGTLIGFGIFQPLPSTVRNADMFFYVPVALSLLPAIMLAAALERVAIKIAKLVDQEAHFRSLYQKAPVMMHSVDSSGRLVSVNDAWLARLGYRSDEVLGRSAMDFFTPESQRHAAQVVMPRFVQDRIVRDVEFQAVTKAGEIVDVEMSAIWETGTDGEPLRTLSVSKDVTEQKRLAAELAAEQERIQVTLHSIGDGVVTTDERGRITYLNPVAETLVGWSLAHAKGLEFSQVVHLFDQNSRQPLPSPVEKCLQQRHTSGLPESAMLRDRSGTEYGIQDSVAPILARDGTLLGSVMVFQDVTEARGLAQKMSYLAHHDGLTGLPNRVLFQDRLLQACLAGQRNRTRMAVVFMDLDHFKHVNDSLGHALGDELLKTVAQRLTGALRSSDTVCRLGGDEFVVLLPELHDADAAVEVAKKIVREVACPCVLEQTEVNVTISLGIAIYPEDGEDPETLMKHADAAMYRSKREGRNRYQCFSRTMDEAATVRLQLEADMRRGLSEGQFTVHYQPVMDSASGTPIAVEALVRWARNGHGMQSPATFIPIAEECGLIVPLGVWVLRQACEQLRTWSDSGLGHLTVAVNVSTLQMAHAGFVDEVAGVLRLTGVKGTQLQIEITESTLMKDSEAILDVLNRLKALGICIAIDDFGTGYSSLSYLKRFPVDTVKIDRSLIRDLETDTIDRELVKAILAMSRSLRLHVIAEGVETEGQGAILTSMDCPAVQGFLFSKPADAATIDAWLRARTETSSARAKRAATR